MFVLAGLAFVIYPVVRPYAAGGADEGPAQFASQWWVVAHLSAVVGFITLGLAVGTLRERLRNTAGERTAVIATITTWVGVGLTLPYYGAETFALHALGAGDATTPGLAESIRTGAVQSAMFATGLLLLAAGVVAAAVAMARSGVVPWWTGIPMAVGFALFIPQFWADPPLRIAHGILVGLGCVLVGVALRRSGSVPIATWRPRSAEQPGAA